MSGKNGEGPHRKDGALSRRRLITTAASFGALAAVSPVALAAFPPGKELGVTPAQPDHRESLQERRRAVDDFFNWFPLSPFAEKFVKASKEVFRETLDGFKQLTRQFAEEAITRGSSGVEALRDKNSLEQYIVKGLPHIYEREKHYVGIMAEQVSAAAVERSAK